MPFTIKIFFPLMVSDQLYVKVLFKLCFLQYICQRAFNFTVEPFSCHGKIYRLDGTDQLNLISFLNYVFYTAYVRGRLILLCSIVEPLSCHRKIHILDGTVSFIIIIIIRATVSIVVYSTCNRPVTSCNLTNPVTA